MPKFKDIIGQRFGRLTVIALHHKATRSPKRQTYWRCRCDCGTEVVVFSGHLGDGHTQSCGCLALETRTKHGQSPKYRVKPGVYNSWHSMLQRCTNPNAEGYEYYGGRGITVCERWYVFANFFADMGHGRLAGRSNVSTMTATMSQAIASGFRMPRNKKIKDALPAPRS